MESILVATPFLLVFIVAFLLTMIAEIRTGINKGALILSGFVFVVGGYSIVIQNIDLSFLAYFSSIAFFYYLIKVEYNSADWNFWSRVVLVRLSILVASYMISLLPNLSDELNLVRVALLVLSLPIFNFEIVPRNPWISCGLGSFMSGTVIQGIVGLELILESGGVPQQLFPMVMCLFVVSGLRVFVALPGLGAILAFHSFLISAALLVSCSLPGDIFVYNVFRLLASVAPVLWVLLLCFRSPNVFWLMLLLFVPLLGSALSQCLIKIDGPYLFYVYCSIFAVSLTAIFKTALGGNRDAGQLVAPVGGPWVAGFMASILVLLFHYWTFILGNGI